MAVISCGGLCPWLTGFAQNLPPVVLTITGENAIGYSWDTPDVSRYGTEPGPTSRIAAKNFLPSVAFVDVTAVNGRAAKGTLLFYQVGVGTSPAPQPGQAIADVTVGQIALISMTLLNSAGNPVGSLFVHGLNLPAPLPGIDLPPPSAESLGALGVDGAVVGGTGAFLGARGQLLGSRTLRASPRRPGSVSEDPSTRRQHGGSTLEYYLRIDPFTRPTIMLSDGRPVIVHASDFSPVTPTRPATRGELLTLIATDLGPTDVPIIPGAVFPTNPLARVLSDVRVLVQGIDAEVLYAGGYPGTANRYQVNFRVPMETPVGEASVQIIAGFIPGPPASIPVR